MQRREHEVAGLRGRDRERDGLQVAHLADEDHVGILAQRLAERLRERLRVRRDLALVDQRLLARVDVLDRVLDGDDVAALGLVDPVDQGRERRRLAAARRAR